MVGIFVPLHGFELLVDLRALNKGVEDVEDGVAAPCIWVFTEELSIFGGGISAGDTVTVAAEGLELVDELVYYIPGPVVLKKSLLILIVWLIGTGGFEMLTVGTSSSTGPSELSI